MIYRIPVVVHIVHNVNSENLSDDVIRSQIEVLNKDYRRLNADATQTRDIFKGVAGDAQIEFYLADTDPNGAPTTGITRKKTDKSSFINFDILLFFQAALACGVDFTDPASIEENMECLVAFFEENGVNFEEIFAGIDDVKYSDKGGTDPWNQKKYLNIWVCDLAVDVLGQSTPFLLGFAYPPVGAPLFPPEELPVDYEKNDGVVIHYQAFGLNNPAVGELAGLNDKGRTCTHEIGHYLGLRHIWGDGDCTVDDGIADTPNAAEASQTDDASLTCNSFFTKNTCNDASNDLPDMIENYMDYSNESCMNIFTQQQINMMRSMLEGPRAELIGLQSSTTETDFLAYKVFPNPASESINILSADNQVYTYGLYNVQGSLLQKGKANGKYQINLESYVNGLYLLQINQGGKIESHKILLKTN
ncbi:MAG: T9SS type A sorting domain-containing protein [Saprospiraceae bacterium]|nr:T9SS type A sorting domain-containing protein [Saprospiraceae bacterium]